MSKENVVLLLKIDLRTPACSSGWPNETRLFHFTRLLINIPGCFMPLVVKRTCWCWRFRGSITTYRTLMRFHTLWQQFKIEWHTGWEVCRICLSWWFAARWNTMEAIARFPLWHLCIIGREGTEKRDSTVVRGRDAASQKNSFWTTRLQLHDYHSK